LHNGWRKDLKYVTYSPDEDTLALLKKDVWLKDNPGIE
jgi:hypothetical protein